jgi:hypothetical protein
MSNPYRLKIKVNLSSVIQYTVNIHSYQPNKVIC